MHSSALPEEAVILVNYYLVMCLNVVGPEDFKSVLLEKQPFMVLTPCCIPVFEVSWCLHITAKKPEPCCQ